PPSPSLSPCRCCSALPASTSPPGSSPPTSRPATTTDRRPSSVHHHGAAARRAWRARPHPRHAHPPLPADAPGPSRSADLQAVHPQRGERRPPHAGRGAAGGIPASRAAGERVVSTVATVVSVGAVLSVIGVACVVCWQAATVYCERRHRAYLSKVL